MLSYILLFFTAFPYVTFSISPIGHGYVQPYCLITGMLVIFLNFRDVKYSATRENLIILFSLVLGVVIFLSAIIFKDDVAKSIEAGFSLGYLAPFSFILLYLSYKIAINNISKIGFRRIFVFSIFVYLTVGLIQVVHDPNFLVSYVGGGKTGLFGEVGEGRGTISLASEPSYYAFHMIALATILSASTSIYLLLMSCLQVIFPAISFSGLIVLVMSMMIHFFSNAKLLKWGILFIIIIIIFLKLAFVYMSSEWRVLEMFDRLFSGDFLYFILIDESASLRIINALMPFVYVINNYFLPMEMFDLTWSKYLSEFGMPWFKNLPENTRIMSGFGEVLVLYGAFVLPLIFKFSNNILWSLKRGGNNTTTFFGLCLFIMMFFTFSFSTPIVALALVVFENLRNEQYALNK